MAYIHNGRGPVTLTADPIDPNSTEWVYFSYQNWLRTGETVQVHTALIEGGTIVTTSTSLGTVADANGTQWTNCYGVKFYPTSGVSKVKVTHRVSTITTGDTDLGRVLIDTTAIIPVVSR